MITKSLCPQCYKEIQAELAVGAHVWMVKECPEHGIFTGMVERDPRWYFECVKLGCTNIYDGLLVDVTSKCNIKCKYCYHDNSGGNRSVQDIIDEIQYYGDKNPFILTGGEPTLHPDIIEIINKSLEVGPTWLLTNGIKICDQDFFHEILNTGLLNGKILNVGLSFHPESDGKDKEFLELCRKIGVMLGTSFYVIDSIDQIENAVRLLEDNQDVLCEIRIKAATNIWNESKAKEKIFVSDMINKLISMGETTIDNRSNNKISYGSVIHKGLPIKLISWYDIDNVDLNDIDCGPWYLAKDGTINNFVTTGLINEGCKGN